MKKNKLEYKVFFWSLLSIISFILYLAISNYISQVNIQQLKDSTEHYEHIYSAKHNFDGLELLSGLIIAFIVFAVLIILIIAFVKRVQRIPKNIHWGSPGHALKFYSEFVSLNLVYGVDEKGRKWKGKVITQADNSYDEDDIREIERFE
jgi:uncharacterized protein YacL